jgi:hypothetical protein
MERTHYLPITNETEHALAHLYIQGECNKILLPAVQVFMYTFFSVCALLPPSLLAKHHIRY